MEVNVLKSRVMYEQQLLEEVKGLSALELGRLLKLVHLVREEFLPKKSEKMPLATFAGCLSDLSDPQLSCFDDATSRRKLFADRKPLE